MFSPEFLLSLVTGGGVLVAGWFGLYWRIYKAENRIHSKVYTLEMKAQRDVDSLRQDILTAKIDIGNMFVRKDTLVNAMSNLDSRLIRLEGKLDTVISSDKREH